MFLKAILFILASLLLVACGDGGSTENTTDTTAPVMTLLGANPLNLQIGDTYTDPGASASDNVDGDITGNIVIAGDTVNTATPGIYVVAYDVSDAAGNQATQVTRTVNVEDNTAPVITLLGVNPLNFSIGGTYTEPGASASDNVDGDITGNIVIAGDSVNTATSGVYVVTYDVSDAAGNQATQVTRTVNVEDNTAPVITLLGVNPLNLPIGGTYNEPGASASDNVDGDITGNIVIAGDTVNTATPDNYVVTYDVSDAAGNQATQVTRTVKVISGTTELIIIAPVQNELLTQTDVDVQATATGFPQNWSVEFVVDNQLGSAVQGSLVPNTSIWKASLANLSKATHRLTAVMADETGVKQFIFSHEITFYVGDYYVAFGDSISQGIGDDISSDNQSMDGRNSSTGYTPILNDLLTASKGYPHNVAVQGINGYTSADGLLDIDAALAAHPESSHFMIQFGTNDSDPGHPVPSGLNKRDGDSGYPGTFKDNMQRLINAVHAAGKIALLAKAPIRYGDCSGNTGTYTCDSYVQRGISPPEDATANGFVREYNLVVDELIQENGLALDPIGSPGVLFIAPDLYTYFNVPVLELDGEGKSPKFSDWLHPNGVGYQEMANLWLQSLLP